MSKGTFRDVWGRAVLRQSEVEAEPNTIKHRFTVGEGLTTEEYKERYAEPHKNGAEKNN